MKEKLTLKKEIRELKILTRPRVTEKIFCGDCQREVCWLLPEEAMLLAQTSLRGIFRLIETKKIHFVESEEGFLLVCAESLAAQIKN